MDLEDIEDLLFGAADTQETFESLWNDDDDILEVGEDLQDSDDDNLLEALESTTADYWQLLSSPLLTPTDTPIATQHNGFVVTADDGTQSTDVGERTLRDRCPTCPAK